MAYIKKQNKMKVGPKNGHGLSYHPLYQIWKGMKNRCYCKKTIGWKYYGGNGVTVCEEWRNDFMAFYNWAISNGWKPGLDIDKDKLSPDKTGKIYSPQFCCFITRKENINNRSVTILVTYNGETKPLSEWAEKFNLSASLLKHRLFKYKMPIDIALTKKVKETKSGKYLEINGEFKTLTQWCTIYNQSYIRVYRRLGFGWSLLDSLTVNKNSKYKNRKIKK